MSSSQAAAAAPAPAAVGQPAPKQGGGLKVVLIVLAIVFGLFFVVVAGIAGLSFYAVHKAKQIRVEQRGKDANVSTPWGNITTTTDPGKVAEQLGVDVYPGAKVLNEGASVTGIAGMNVVTAKFESNDPIDKVQQFYRSKFPHSDVNAGDENSSTIVSTGDGGAVTIVLHKEEGKTKIEISRVGGGPGKTAEASQ